MIDISTAPSSTRSVTMGKNTDKLYVTHSEHTGVYGGRHTASSSGYVQCALSKLGSRSCSDGTLHRKPDAGPPQARQPFDCCALSFQPFEHPVCARNDDGTGLVFDLVNIIPWLKYVSGTRHPASVVKH